MKRAWHAAAVGTLIAGGCSSDEPESARNDGGALECGGSGGFANGGSGATPSAGGGVTGDAAGATGGASGAGGSNGDASVPFDAADGDAWVSDSSIDGASPCSGPVLQGSVLIHNANDVLAVAPYAQITGDLLVDAAGLTTVSLPSLCVVGGAIQELDAPDVTTWNLPALVSAGSISLGSGALHTVVLDKLEKTTGIDGNGLIALYSSGALSLPAVESVPGGVTLHGTTISIPNLSGSTPVVAVKCSSCTIALNSLDSVNQLNVSNATVTATQLASIGTWGLSLSGAGSLSLPALKTVTGSVSLEGSTLDLSALSSVGGFFTLKTSGAVVHLNSLASVGGDFSVEGIGLTNAISLPALASIGGNLKIQGTGTATISLPILNSIGGTAAPTIDFTGGFAASALAQAPNGMIIRKVAAIELPSLQAVGAPGWQHPLDIDATTIAILNLPNLTSACVLFGLPGWKSCNPTCSCQFTCASGNAYLTGVTAPKLTQGGLEFFNNPSFPQCRADALATQIANPILYSGCAGHTHCTLASGPCP